MVILSPHRPARHRVPITRWPSVFAKWRLRRTTGNSVRLPSPPPPFRPRSSPSIPDVSPFREGRDRSPSLPPSFSSFVSFQDFSASADSPSLSLFSLTQYAHTHPAHTEDHLHRGSPLSSPVPLVRSSRSPIPFARPLRPFSEQVLSTPSSFPLSASVTSMIILRPAINRER